MSSRVQAFLNKAVRILYRNWKGELALRVIVPTGELYWGKNQWHKEEQWLLDAVDIEKCAVRSFAILGILYTEAACLLEETLSARSLALLQDALSKPNFPQSLL